MPRHNAYYYNIMINEGVKSALGLQNLTLWLQLQHQQIIQTKVLPLICDMQSVADLCRRLVTF